MECQGVEIEPSVMSGCSGGVDCSVCDGTGVMKNCPSCFEQLHEDDTCSSCEMIWAEV
jgi:hypothetical protein